MIIAIYFVLATIVVLLSIKLSYYVDLLDKKTDLSGAFIGGVLLAAVTSLPEFFTSISSTVFLDEPELVMGNILGSNLFNLAAMSIICLLFFKAFKEAFIGQSHKTTLKCALLIYVLLTAGIFFKLDPHFLTISFYSVIISIVYFNGIKTMSNDDGLENVEEEPSTHLTIAQIGRRFTLCSLLLVITSIAVTFATDRIAETYNLSTTFAGALLLGVATSLPELASSLNLAKLGNFNALTGNILGSNLFNFFIIVVADITYIKRTVYIFTPSGFSLLIFGLVAHIAMNFIILCKTAPANTNQSSNNFIYIVSNIAVVACYGLFIFMSL